uniref:zinc finger protein 131-like isoform X2 n=1 Tax=Myxine glutinosa TaxID=7769 RepID=UPI00358F6AEB
MKKLLLLKPDIETITFSQALTYKIFHPFLIPICPFSTGTGHRFRAHKAVLAASSRFFHSFFKQVQEDTVVAIEGLSELAFGHLLEFIYTGIIYVEGVELDLVLKAAEFLQMDEAIIVLKKRAASQTSTVGHPNNQMRTISETCKVVTESLPELLDSTSSTLQYNQESGKDLGTTPIKIEQSDSALVLLADLIKSSQEGNSPEEQNNSTSDNHIPNSKSLQKCQKQFSHDVNFKTQQAHHSQGQETVHVCDYCQKAFQHLGHYKEHLRKHTGEKPFKCPMCHVNYGRKSSLKIHLQVCNSVEGAKKGRRKFFVCQVCETSFQRWENFKDHLISHTGKKPYYCPDCDKWFMWPTEFQDHCYSTHGRPGAIPKQEASNTER